MTAPVTVLLSRTQTRILTVIREYGTTNGYAPSVREVAGSVGRSVSAVQYQIGQLEQKGWIRRHPHRPRALVVLNPADGSDT
ncbi:LexA family protein [Micromonosporaceae bacterium Da 78-11]